MHNYEAKPFLKWAGGKGQLLTQIKSHLPPELLTGKITTYVEPFVGGGALFFFLMQQFEIERAYLLDVNEELIVVYQVVKKDVEKLIAKLKKLQSQYNSLSDTDKKTMFYEVRAKFSMQRTDFNYKKYSSKWVERASNMMFLNRTCFNGLFRVNSKGEFNVPVGKYKNPTICDENNLLAANYLLQKAEISFGDFEACKKFVDENTFIYFDPPYRPLSITSRFTSYNSSEFTDESQIRLASFYKELTQTGAKLMLSNSDPKNIDPNDCFFEDLYSDFKIIQVKANRMINCNGDKRGEINELIIINY